MFKHDFLRKIDIQRIDSPEGRYYISPNGVKLPSVTSILDNLDNKMLDKWKKRVGQDEAKKIATQAKNRGSGFHKICENYLLNDPDYKKDMMPFVISDFFKIKPILEKNINMIYGIEHMLYSEKLKCAGTTDLICNWNGKFTVADFKTSRYMKKEKNILNYFIQSTTYALMIEELYGIVIPQIAIIISVDHEDPLLFVKEKKEYVDIAKGIFK